MAGKEAAPKKLSWKAIKPLCSDIDIERLACLAITFLMTDDVDKSRYQLAAEQFGGGIKPDSFRRGLWVITKRIKDAAASAGKAGDVAAAADGDEKAESTATKQKASDGKGGKGGGKKRKALAAAECDEGEEAGVGGDEEPVSKKTKKSKAVGGGEDNAVVKEEDLDEIFS